jgi:hypothetical protein
MVIGKAPVAGGPATVIELGGVDGGALEIQAPIPRTVSKPRARSKGEKGLLIISKKLNPPQGGFKIRR